MKKLTIAPRVGKRYLELLESAVGTALPSAFKNFLLGYAGLSVVENTFKDQEGRLWQIQSFDHVASMIDLTKEFTEAGWGKKLPFAFDPGGWHYCLSFDQNSVGEILVNRWTDHSEQEQFIVIANTFEEFINGLYRGSE